MAEPAGKTAPEQITLATRQQIMLDRLKSAEVAKFKPFLQQAERDLQMRLIAADIETYDAKRIQILLDAIERDLRAIFGGYTTQLTGDLIDAAVYQAQLEARNLETISKVPFESVIPSPEQVRTAVMTAPLAVQGYRQGALLEPWLQGWTDDSIAYVNGVIQQGYYQGKNTAEIVRSLRGTSKMRGQDGTLAQIDRANTVLVRTAVQHSAQVARETFFRANDDIVLGLEWVAALDSRTTIQCRSLDGKRFPLDSGPRPPLHPQCRSTTIAVLDPAL
jgi:SPP1 gp7 family putative phage head morphogenesis protein